MFQTKNTGQHIMCDDGNGLYVTVTRSADPPDDAHGEDHMIRLHGNNYKLCERLKIKMPEGDTKMFSLAKCTITVDEKVTLHWLDDPKTKGLFNDENQVISP